MPSRTRQSNKRRPVRLEVKITPTASGIPAEWQQPSAPRQPTDRRTRGSPPERRPAEPSGWHQSPGAGKPRGSQGRSAQAAVQPSQGAAPDTQPRRRKRKRRPPLSTVLFPKRARRHSAPDNRAERQKQRLKRQRRYLVLSKLFTTLLILGTGIFALTLFFKVDTVTIEGRSRYTRSQLLETAAIEKGDNLFLLPKRSIRNRLYDEYPYLDSVQVEQKPPNKVILHVEDAIPAAAVGSGATYYYMDASGKLLEQVSLDQLGGIPVVTGVTVDNVEVGKRLNMRRDERLRQLTVLLTALEEQDLMRRVDFINLSDMANVRIGCDGHMYIRFGTMEQLEHKMLFAKKFVEETSPSLFCEIEVSGEILWEGHASYRVIPVSEEEVAAQSRDLDAAVTDGETPDGTGDGTEGADAPAAPVLGGTSQGADGDGESGSDQTDSTDSKQDQDHDETDASGQKKNEDADTDGTDDDDGDDADKPASNAPALSFPPAGSTGNWRNSQ